MISIWGTGTDNIDLESAKRRGITVSNTAGVNANAVAEHTIALMLTVARRIPKIDREMRTGAWPREMLTQLFGKTLGVFGTGTIGMRVIALGRALGMEVLAWSARGDTTSVDATGARTATKEAILREADVVTLHLRLSPETRGFLSQPELSLMKQPAILINTGRGALVERAALLDALGQGKIWPDSTSSTMSRSRPAIRYWPCPTSYSRRTTQVRPPRSSAMGCCARLKTSSTFYKADRPGWW